MADDYYDGLEEEAPTATEEKAEGEEKTSLLDKALFADAKPGDRITLEIVRVFEEQVEAKPVSTSNMKEEEEPSVDEEIDLMASEME